jgi:predicted transcriptional regulator
MQNTFYKRMDPLEIQNRFSEDFSFFSFKESNFKLEDFEPFLQKLPIREVDLINMYYRKDKKQKEIAEFFGVTQGAVSHRLSRARKRLAFLRDMPKVTGDIKKDLAKHFNEFEIDIIIYMAETTCQSKTADLLNDKYELPEKDKMTQVKVRHKFDRFIDKMKKLKRLNPEVKVYYDLSRYIKKNLYMLHEVILPHFDKGYQVKYDGVY